MKHKYAAEIVAWSQGNTVQHFNESVGDWVDCCKSGFYFSENTMFRIKPQPAIPKTSLSVDELWGIYIQYKLGSAKLDLQATANDIIKHFITSGQMDAYIVEREA